MANLDITTKSNYEVKPGVSASQKVPAAEINSMVNWANSPMKSLGAFDPAMTFDSQGMYNVLTLSTNIELTATGIIDGNVRTLWIVGNSTNSITLGAGMSSDVTDLNGVLATGTYLAMFASFKDSAGVSKVYVSVPNMVLIENVILFEALFTGVTPNASNWPTINNPNGYISQNDEWLVDMSNGVAFGNQDTLSDSWSSPTISPSDLLVLRTDFINNLVGDPTFNTGNVVVTLYDSDIGTNNQLVLQIKIEADGNHFYRILTRKDGSYDNVEDHLVATNQSIKLVYNNVVGTIQGYYWNGSAWAAFGAEGTIDLSNVTAWKIAVSAAQAGTAATVTGDVAVDNVYLTDYDYTTLTP